MRTFARVLGVAVVLAGVALGSASPASARDTMQGNYTYSAPGLPAATWTIYPICVNVIGDLRVPLEDPVACTLHIVSATSMKTTPQLDSLNWGGDAHLTGGVWQVIVNRNDGFQCPDGSTAPLFRTFEFDDSPAPSRPPTTRAVACLLR
jgi:hypothetical protein